MHVCGHAGGVLAVEDGLGIARLGGLHELKLVFEVGLILRRNREVKCLCGSDSGLFLSVTVQVSFVETAPLPASGRKTMPL